MKLTINQQTFAIELENNAPGKSIRAMCPLALELARSGDHEYYAALPKKADTRDAAETERVKRDGVYYFAAWNALALVFRDTDIAPWSVHPVGHADGISKLLESAGGTVRMTLE